MNDGSSVSGFYQDVNVVVPNELLMFVQSLLTTYSTCRAFFSKRGRLIAILDYILLPSNDQRSSFSYFFFFFSLFFFFFCSFFLLGESVHLFLLFHFDDQMVILDSFLLFPVRVRDSTWHMTELHHLQAMLGRCKSVVDCLYVHGTVHRRNLTST